jgi:hypothetical protein
MNLSTKTVIPPRLSRRPAKMPMAKMSCHAMDAKAKYTADKRPSGPICGWAMMKPHVSMMGASATAIEGKSMASGIR